MAGADLRAALAHVMCLGLPAALIAVMALKVQLRHSKLGADVDAEAWSPYATDVVERFLSVSSTGRDGRLASSFAVGVFCAVYLIAGVARA